MCPKAVISLSSLCYYTGSGSHCLHEKVTKALRFLFVMSSMTQRFSDFFPLLGCVHPSLHGDSFPHSV